MKIVGIAALLLSLSPLALCAQTSDAHLNSVLGEMDAASTRFQHATSNFEWSYYEAVTRDTTTDKGTIYFEHAKGGAVQMGAVVYTASGTKKQVLEYKDAQLQLFDLGVDQIRRLSAGSNQAQYETFLTLGFGGTGRELARAWDIKDLGAESIVDSGAAVKVEKLDLVSKDASVRNMFTHITIWVDPSRGVTLKQVFDTPQHDRRTAIYSNIKVNGAFDRKAFAIVPGKKTTHI